MTCELVRIEWQSNAWAHVGNLEVEASLLRLNFIRNLTNLIDRDVTVCLQLFGIANCSLGDGLTGFDVLEFDSMTWIQNDIRRLSTLKSIHPSL